MEENNKINLAKDRLQELAITYPQLFQTYDFFITSSNNFKDAVQVFDLTDGLSLVFIERNIKETLNEMLKEFMLQKINNEKED